MADVVSQEVNIEMRKKLPDGTYRVEYPKTRSDSGVTFDEHLADKATQNKYGHVKLSDIKTNITDDITGVEYKWGMENGLVYLEEVVF